MARRREIVDVVDQQHAIRELGRIRFGERKRPNSPGRPIQFPRVSSQRQEIVADVAKVYGGEVRQWDRDNRREWDVTVEQPLAIAVPPNVRPFSRSYELWAGGVCSRRCDGERCQVTERGRKVERPCACGVDADPEDRECKLTLRFGVMILGLPWLGLFRVDSKGVYAAREVPAQLGMLQASGRAGWLRMESRERLVVEWDADKGAEKVQKRKYPVIVVDAPFMPEEVMALERPPGMEALPAPEIRARPQIAATVEPRGPQFGDREPPPRPVPPVELGDGRREPDDPPAPEPPIEGQGRLA